MSLNLLTVPNSYELYVNELHIETTPAFPSAYLPLAVQNVTGLVGTYTPAATTLSLDPIGNAPNPDGMLLTGTVLQLEPADGTHGGAVTAGTQTFGGAKTFNNNITLAGGVNIEFTDFANQGIFNPGSDPIFYSAGSDTNIFAGALAGSFAQAGLALSNTGVGNGALQSITTGGINTALGIAAGSAYVAGESNNICIGANVTGVLGESNKIHIGDDNTKIGCYIGGINSVPSTTPPVMNVVCDSSNQITSTSSLFLNGFGTVSNVGIFDTSGNSILLAGSSASVSATNITLGINSGSGTGSNNTILGSGSYINIVGGASFQNTVIGQNAGNAYTTTEANNVVIGYNIAGLVGESNAIHIADNSATSCFIGGIGGITVAGAVPAVINAATGQLGTVVSSQRFKNSINPIDDDISSKVLDLECVSFKYNNSNGDINFGFIAEDVNEILPEVVVYDPKLDENDAIVHDEYDQVVYTDVPSTIQYQLLWPLLQNEVKKLAKIIKKHEALIFQLQDRIDALEKL